MTSLSRCRRARYGARPNKSPCRVFDILRVRVREKGKKTSKRSSARPVRSSTGTGCELILSGADSRFIILPSPERWSQQQQRRPITRADVFSTRVRVFEVVILVFPERPMLSANVSGTSRRWSARVPLTWTCVQFTGQLMRLCSIPAESEYKTCVHHRYTPPRHRTRSRIIPVYVMICSKKRLHATTPQNE